jgi:hypothetical protein
MILADIPFSFFQYDSKAKQQPFAVDPSDAVESSLGQLGRRGGKGGKDLRVLGVGPGRNILQTVPPRNPIKSSEVFQLC